MTVLETRKATKQLKKLTGCNKRKVFVSVRPNMRVQPSYWSEGSRTLTYRLAGNSLVPVESNSSPFDQRERPQIDLERGMVFVELGCFCCEEATPMLIASSEEDFEGLAV